MSEEEMIEIIVGKIGTILSTKYPADGTDETDHWAMNFDNEFCIYTFASIICAHLKLFLSTIVQHMTHYKKKHLFFCHKLNKKRDPRMHRSKKSRTMSSVIAYENTLFTAKDFFQLLKDHEDLIPSRSLYHKYIEQLMSMDSVKPYVPRAISYDNNDEEAK